MLCAAACAGLALTQGAPLAAERRAAQKGWGASLEGQAEFAYRSVYERSLGTQKPQRAESRRGRPVAVQTQVNALIPEMPVKRSEALGEAAASPPVSAAAPAAPEPAAQASAQASGWQPSDDPLGNPPLHQSPGNIDVATTQIIDSGEGAAPQAGDPKPAPRGPGEQYCSNIANAASDARFVWQKQILTETEKQVQQRLDELNVKIAEYQKWLARRDEFSRKAQAAITSIYAKMRPDAAAQQLMALDDETAAAVITQLNPRVSSALMAEMDPKQAARLTAIISAAGKGPKGKPPVTAKPQSGGT